MTLRIILALAVLALGGVGHCSYSAHYIEQGRFLERGERAKADAEDARIARETAEAQRKVTEEQGHEIEVLRRERDEQAAAARAAIRPVRLCQQPAAASEPTGPSAAAADPTDGPGAAEGLPLLAGPDIGPALLMLVESCQRDNDDKFAWRRYSERQAKLIDSLYTMLGETLP